MNVYRMPPPWCLPEPPALPYEDFEGRRAAWERRRESARSLGLTFREPRPLPRTVAPVEVSE